MRGVGLVAVAFASARAAHVRMETGPHGEVLGDVDEKFPKENIRVFREIREKIPYIDPEK